MKIKVCGLRQRENIHEVAGLGPDLLGFNFYPGSPRYAGSTLVPGDLTGLPSQASRTGVFVNAGISDVEAITRNFDLHYAQLHGDEPASYCRQLSNKGIGVIKVFRLHEKFDFGELKAYLPFISYLLFDTPTAMFGGSGRRFDWDILQGYELEQPFFLSGGIGPGDEESILSMKHPALAGIDINSRFELTPGIKDTDKLRTFIQKIKNNPQG